MAGRQETINNLYPHIHDLRQKLATAYHIIHFLGLDDLTYTHITVRIPGTDHFYIGAFGLLFDEVTSDNLLTVDSNGHVLEGQEYQYNRTAYILHGGLYKARPDIQAIYHLHTPATVAMSVHPEGLLPVTQWALHFYGQLSYHDYDSLALNPENYPLKLSQDLGDRQVLIMKNHGFITCGKNLHEALFYAYHLEQASRTQAMINQGHMVRPTADVCKRTNHDLLTFEEDLGLRDWLALERAVQRKNSWRSMENPCKNVC